MRNPNDGMLDIVPVLRDIYAADEVLLLLQDSDGGYLGIA